MPTFSLHNNLFRSAILSLLLALLLLSPCATKQSLKHVFNVENNPSPASQSSASCQYIQHSVIQTEAEQAASAFRYNADTSPRFAKLTTSVSAVKTGRPNARSVPLYILYRQLRAFLV